jgi:hypothetical protein
MASPRLGTLSNQYIRTVFCPVHLLGSGGRRDFKKRSILTPSPKVAFFDALIHSNKFGGRPHHFTF